MQKFKCHKVVEAGKIRGIFPPDPHDAAQQTILDVDGERVGVIPQYLERHHPEVGGYFVQYEDNYISYSPAPAFEAGYTPLAALMDIDALAIDDPILKYFTWAHLPAHLQEHSRPFAEMALWIVRTKPRNAERTAALRKLLECKDAAVRAALP